jgi:hypothetical protein
MSREAHVRFYEGLGVAFPRPTHPVVATELSSSTVSMLRISAA